MNFFTDVHQAWLKRLIENKVDFIVVGGYSVVFHGYKRTTGDVDVWLKPSNENKDRLLKALAEDDFEDEDLAHVASLDFRKHIAFSVGDEPERIDFMTYIAQVAYDEADKLRILADIDGISIPFLHINHLVLSKFNTGRSKDQADVQMLQKIIAQRKE